jgi:hypothetical protein
MGEGSGDPSQRHAQFSTPLAALTPQSRIPSALLGHRVPTLFRNICVFLKLDIKLHSQH